MTTLGLQALPDQPLRSPPVINKLSQLDPDLDCNIERQVLLCRGSGQLCLNICAQKAGPHALSLSKLPS